MDTWIFKILRENEWMSARDNPLFPGAPVDVSDGYVHFSTATQIQETADKHFSDAETVYILAFDSDGWASKLLKWEVSRGGALFPHLYSTLDIELAHKTWVMSKRAEKKHDLKEIIQWAENND